jgi:predicted DNA-binding protein (MmcQ/YjbR family)
MKHAVDEARLFARPVFARARRACLALAGTSETESWHHPTFRAGTVTFCAFEIIKGRPSIAFKLPVTDLAFHNQPNPFATPYGRGMWTSIWVDDEVDDAAIQTLVRRSYDCRRKKSR